MNLRSYTFALLVIALSGPVAIAGDKPLLKLFGASGTTPSKATKPYPILEHKYIKLFAGPTVACGSCYGYFPTQWRAWNEACNEPQVVEAGPVRIETPPEPVPQPPAVPIPEKTRETPPAPKPTELKKPETEKTEAKPNKKVELPALIPAPSVAKPANPQPVPVGVELVVPSLPNPIPDLPAEKKAIVPTIIVPLGSK